MSLPLLAPRSVFPPVRSWGVPIVTVVVAGLVSLEGLPAQCELGTPDQIAAPVAVTVGDFVGWSVAIHQDTVLVGAPERGGFAFESEPGYATVFQRENGLWTEEQQLAADPGQPFDQFGWRVALTREWAFVSTNGARLSRPGAVHTFRRGDGPWTEVAVVSPTDHDPGTRFGSPLVASGNAFATMGNQHSYVYRFLGGAWREEARLDRSSSVALQGDLLALGDGSDDSAANDAGAVHLYQRVEGAWIYRESLSIPVASLNLGRSLALRNDLLVAGADDEVVIFRRARDQWTLEQRLPREGGTPFFGSQVGIGRDTVVVVEPDFFRDTDLGGHAQVYRRVAGLWEKVRILQDPTIGGADLFPQSIAVHGGQLVGGVQSNSDEFRGWWSSFQLGEMGLSRVQDDGPSDELTIRIGPAAIGTTAVLRARFDGNPRPETLTTVNFDTDCYVILPLGVAEELAEQSIRLKAFATSPLSGEVFSSAPLEITVSR